MEQVIRREGWAKGIDNKSNTRDMPEGSVRDSVNFDPLTSGTLALRSDAVQKVAGTNIRGALAAGHHILLADGDTLKVFDTKTGATTALATIDSSGLFAGAELNGELFFCTTTQCLRYSPEKGLRRWGVPTVTTQPMPTVTDGGLAAGTYQLAMTWFDTATGEEGGTTLALSIMINDGQGLSVTLPAMTGYTPRLYVSHANGSTLYLQAAGDGTYLISSVDVGTARLQTMHYTHPTPFTYAAQHNSTIAFAHDRVMWLTDPMHPHLVSPSRSFFQFADDVGMVLSVNTGLYVSADKTWYISDVSSDSPAAREVFPFPAVPGSGAMTPDGRAGWMTPYGVCIGGEGGQVRLLSDDRFAPQLADKGSSGIVQWNGNQLFVTTMPGDRVNNGFVAQDYFEGEVIIP